MQQQSAVDLAPWFEVLREVEAPLVWSEFFGNDQPVELDIGCGRGLFLVQAGMDNPGINYLGIEIDYREARHGAARLKKRSLTNVRVLGGDARKALREWVPPGSVSAAHVYFPDPWWKRRHRRRRIFNEHLVDLLHTALQPGGEVHSWTDVEEYFDVIRRMMDSDPRFETLPAPEEKPAEHDMDYHTSFERKKRKDGETIYRGRWRKHAS